MKWLKYFLIALAAFIGFLYWEFYTVVTTSEEPIFFEITPGEPFKHIIPRLKENGLIRNEMFFKYYADLTGLDTEVKAGRFRLDPPLTPARVLHLLTNPENEEIAITIPEGNTIFDIDEKLTEKGIIEDGAFIAWAKSQPKPVEGYLFPDTYFIFSKNFDPADLGQKMLANFEMKVREGLKEDFIKSSRSIEDIIIMASILEKEVRTKEDYPIVSGILWKRLDNGWPLQTDATLLYGKKDRTITPEVLEEDSPYNTYTRKDLPETPIGNPGLMTIRATLNPIDSPYWFYLTDEDGKVIYAKTNEEHDANKRKFL